MSGDRTDAVGQAPKRPEEVAGRRIGPGPVEVDPDLLVRAGGLVMWHDFAPRSDARDSSVTAAQVTNQLLVDWSSISECFDRLFWIEPSWLLVGVRNAGAGVEAASLTVR